ncbi:MAG: hypothetical protein IT329_14840 [Caldilineaceae bacterium]|nr:hypothetical protein [Caldilineaceae bacterium]
MKGLRILLLLLIVIILVLSRPRAVWAQVQHLRERSNYVLGVLVGAVIFYLLYGLYTMYERGMLNW